MKKSRIIVLFLAVAAAAGAFILANSPKGPPVTVVSEQAPAPVPTDDVLVAAKDLSFGTPVNESELSWEPWPKDKIPGGMIRKSENPKIIDEIKGSFARASLLKEQPIRREQLVKGDGGLMALTLPSGMRAVAINIDSQGSTSAGGFILPGDRVDVIKTFREDNKAAGGGDNFTSDTLLENVKVRAIGPNVQQKDGQTVVVGSNATLELSPEQAQQVVLAQRTGQLSLTLRSALDTKEAPQAHVRAPAPASPAAAPAVPAPKNMTIVKFGTKTEDANR